MARTGRDKSQSLLLWANPLILLSVGTQFPFDRMVRVVDEWAAAEGRDDVLAQIGPSTYLPKALKCFGFSTPDEFRSLQAKADLMIAHAGMGSIVTALEFGKPIIIMPRDFDRGEHRNDHQKSTARRFANLKGVHLVMDEAELAEKLHNLEALTAPATVSAKAPQSFIDSLKAFIDAPNSASPKAREVKHRM